MRASMLRSLVAVCLVGGAVWGLSAGGAAGQDYPLPPQTGPLPELKPFPQIRIAGVATRRGTVIDTLTVRARVGVIIVSRCKGGKAKRCPYRKRTQMISGQPGKTRRVHIERFERRFRSGARLRLYVMLDGRTGKYTSFRIRRRKAPERRDRCLRGRVLKTIACPT